MAGLLAVPALGFTQEVHVKQHDPRITRLERFFSSHASPLVHFAAEFLTAADKNGLDWRLLPSISLVESGGGKAYKNNNIFGWNSGRSQFSSITSAIHHVAATLATSRLYRHKSVDAILRTYNSRPEYCEKVKTVMQTIGEADLSETAAALN